tara:strand:+ start:723 stop:890 length:168 start_codon:yes stop_codon:yes gene_type:complete
MSKHTGRAKRIYDNSLMKRPSDKNRKHKASIKLLIQRNKTKLLRREIERQQQKEY